jgi:hypothetical protein
MHILGNLAEWAPAIITVLAAIFTAGQLVGRIKNQEITLAEHHDSLCDHDARLDNHENRLNRSEAWREGYNAATNKEHKQP